MTVYNVDVFEDAQVGAAEFSAELIWRETDQLGAQLLTDQAATGFEKALASLEAGILLDINAELIIDTWDPHATFLRNLPFLAWSYDVNIWEDGWSEETQREWVHRQHEFKRIRGSIDAMRMALDFSGRDFAGYGGYIVKQVMTPPQGMFFAPGLTVEEHNAWLRLMPELRIYIGSEFGVAGSDQFYDDGFYDVDFTAYDNGWELYGRKSILHQAGKADVNLKVIQRTTINESGVSRDWEQISTRGFSSSGLFFDLDSFSDENYFSSAEVDPSLYNVTLDRSFDRFSTELHLSYVRPTQEPIDVTYERNSDIGDQGPWMHFSEDLRGAPGASYWGVDFVKRDDAPLMLADRLWLYDPSIATPMASGHSYFDVDRWGFPAYHVELLIDLQTRLTSEGAWGEDSFWDDMFFQSTDLTHVDRACRAVVAAKSLRDRALVQFDIKRAIESSDQVYADTLASDWVPNNL